MSRHQTIYIVRLGLYLKKYDGDTIYSYVYVSSLYRLQLLTEVLKIWHNHSIRHFLGLDRWPTEFNFPFFGGWGGENIASSNENITLIS